MTARGLEAELAKCQEALMAQAAIGADLARAAFADLLPPCPTCGGTSVIDDGSGQWQMHLDPCPDCVDGKVSIEQLVATYNAVHGDNELFYFTGELAEYRDYLRSVKP